MFATLFHISYWLNQVGPNVAALVPCGILGWFWARAKFFPLNLIHAQLNYVVRAHRRHASAIDRVEKSLVKLHERHDDLDKRLDDLSERHDELHEKVDEFAR